MPAFLALLALPAFNLNAYEKPRVVAEANAVIAIEPKTITAARNPRSAGGLHDWSSEGDYWWPDPKNPNGPYIQRDGMTNPDNFVAHRQFMLDFVREFDALAAAYELSGDDRYAAAGVKHLRAWFVNPDTRMNPNLDYSQAIKGLYVGRGIGVIDTLQLAEVALGIEALRKSPAFPKADQDAVLQWFTEYLHWMKTSKNGVTESNEKNNHGTCWVLQVAAFAHLVGDQATLEDCRHRFKDILLPNQMAPDGSFPKELARTKAFGYSIFNLDVMSGLAVLLSTPKEDLMTYSLPDGRSLVKGVAFLEPFIADKSKWPKKPDVMYWDNWPVRQPSVLFGAASSGNEAWLKVWESLDPDPSVEEIRRNFPIRQPVLWYQH